MRKGTVKRGFMPPQPAAALSALDFAAASQGLARARAAYEAATETNDLNLAAAAIGQTADRLVSTPAATIPEIAEKVSAFAAMRGHAWDLSRPAEQRRIAEEGDDDEKGLLAIYLDLIATAQAQADQRQAWSAATAAHDAARAKAADLLAAETEDDDSDAWDQAARAESEALEALLNLRAPDAAAMADKARRGINQAYAELKGESADDPDTIERLLAEQAWDGGSIVAALFQDALVLAGDTGPITRVGNPVFRAEAWLAATETLTGSRLVADKQAWTANYTGTPDQQRAAHAAFTALKPWQQEHVVRHISRHV